MKWIYKFAKNCRVGDYVMLVAQDHEPAMHAYWKIIEITTDFVRYEVGYTPQHRRTAIGDLNDIVMIRPNAPLSIRPELFEQYYGPGGFWHPWPWDYKKPLWQLKQEIGEDMSADVYRKWKAESYNKQKALAKIDRPELVIRTMHDRAVDAYYDNWGQADGESVGTYSPNNVLSYGVKEECPTS